MLSDIEIAQRANPRRIVEVAEDKLGIKEEHLDPYGHYKAKLSLDFIRSLEERTDGKLILVSGISPTPPGEGKTTTTVGLGDALNRIGETAITCIREPSLGPVFGIKGGAAGGGYAQVIPMEDINLHFTGDFSAIALANNLLSALVDNHVHQGNDLGLDLRRIVWKRVVDMNDRALRDIVVGLGATTNGFPREDAFDIVVASEVMAILCLATSLEDLKERLGNIVVGYTRDEKPVVARELNAHGAMAVLLRDAIKPNLVQTLEGNPAFVHGGPFANIAHGCNSVMATKTALKLADYVLTEAGFGADLGAEKFVDIKCRMSGLRPSMVVLVATINNVRNHFGLPCVVAINRFPSDTEAEISLLQEGVAHQGAQVVLTNHWAKGGVGAEELAYAIVDTVERVPARFRFVYDEEDGLWDKISAVATKIYGASEVVADTRVRRQIHKFQEDGYGRYPVCIAKTQYSFSTDPSLRGAPSGHVLPIREVRLCAGAEFVVAVCGDIMTMPGLPKSPASERIDLGKNGEVIGLF
jgi:formate--tetrahydrofolate ligase